MRGGAQPVCHGDGLCETEHTTRGGGFNEFAGGGVDAEKSSSVEYGGCPKPCHGGIAMRCGLRRKKYAPAQSQRSICVKISAQSAVGEAREARRARAEDGDTQQPTDNTHVTNIY